MELVFDAIFEFKPVKLCEALELVQSLFDKGDNLVLYPNLIHYRGEVFDCVVIFGFSKKITRAVRIYVALHSAPEGYAPQYSPAWDDAKKISDLLNKYGYNTKVSNPFVSVDQYECI